MVQIECKELVFAEMQPIFATFIAKVIINAVNSLFLQKK